MLNEIRFWTDDSVWRKILVELGAIYVDNKIIADINIDSIDLPEHASVAELKVIFLNIIEKNQKQILNEIFKQDVFLSKLQLQIIILLFKTNGLSLKDARDFLGYSPDVITHAVDTAIYQLRKNYGRDFIKNEDGKYYIGKL